jgi:YegS C-terminal NAD kinase beta sandwich-like domain
VTAIVDPVVVESDDALAAVVSQGAAGRAVVARGGDLHRTLGSPTGVATRRLPIDVMAVTADGRVLTAVAHVVARRRGRCGWWRGRLAAVMNVDHIGTWDVAPRAHPNDGWLDVVEVDEAMSRRARWQAWRRLDTGTHLPHPDIATRRVRDVTLSFDPAVALWVDGVDRGDVRELRVSVAPDGAEIYI